MARLERGNDALGPTQVVEGIKRLLVRDAHIFRALNVCQVGMLGANPRLVQARADGVRLGDLPQLIL